jgi:DNA polymerase-3 subunit alpha
MIGYRTAYLKAHYPEEFMASLLNADSGDTERISFLINEARQSNVEVLPPDINRSFARFSPEGEKIRFGLLAIKNVGQAISEAIVAERVNRGPFKDFTDMLSRVNHKDLNKKSLESLAKGGAFDSMGIERNQILENIDEILRYAQAARRGGVQTQNSLFGNMPAPAASPLKLKPVEPATSNQRLAWEKELLGFYLSDHPLNSYRAKITEVKARNIDEIRGVKNTNLIYRTAGIISKTHKIITKNGQPMLFVTLEDFSPQPLELVIFNNILQKTQNVWNDNAVIVVEGKVNHRNGEPSLIVERAKVLEA